MDLSLNVIDTPCESSDEADTGESIESAKRKPPPATTTPNGGHHHYNNWSVSIKMDEPNQGRNKPIVASGQQQQNRWIDGLGEITNRLLDQNHHYVNGIALRENVRHTRQYLDPENLLLHSVHNNYYLNKRLPQNLAVNECYNLALPYLASSICDMKEDVI